MHMFSVPVLNRLDETAMTFMLVKQADRRQLDDRRSVWRGGRRASDLTEAGRLFVPSPSTTPAGDVQR